MWKGYEQARKKNVTGASFTLVFTLFHSKNHHQKPYPAQEPDFNLDSNKWFPGDTKQTCLLEKDDLDQGRVTYFSMYS